jgi:amino acid permease
MKFWASTCKVLGYIWLVLAGLLILAGIIGVWMKEGFSGVQDLLSPFNVVNYIVTLLTLAPGIGLLMLSDRLQSKAEK